jgi:xanthine/CO dehydrogenase XdhC/CoxF family maturation factor
MSLLLARRLAHVEGERLAAAITHFAGYCRRVFTAPDAAADAADPEGAEDTPFTLALWPVIALTTAHPTDHPAIRAALAAVAPFVALPPSAGPLPILAALEGVLGDWERDAQG